MSSTLAASPVTARPSDSRSTAELSTEQDQLMDAVFAMFGADELPEGMTSAGNTPPWVLSIDDDVDFSDAMKSRLESHGVAVVRAYNGMEGYRMAFSQPCSTILLDYNMPNGQGDYVLRRLKESPVTSDIPVVMITGVKDKSVERKVRGLGAAAYFEKPVKFEDLRHELSKYIDILAEPSEPGVETLG